MSDKSPSKDKTLSKTLWSETLVEILIISLQKKSSDKDIKEIIKELRSKGFKKSYIRDKVQKELGNEAAYRIKLLLGD